MGCGKQRQKGGKTLYREEHNSMFILQNSFTQSKHQSKPGISYYDYNVHYKLGSDTISARVCV